MITDTVSTLVCFLSFGGILVLFLSPLMLCMTYMSLFTSIPILRKFLLLMGMLNVALHRMRDLVDVPHLPVLFDPVNLLSESKWW